MSHKKPMACACLSISQIAVLSALLGEGKWTYETLLSDGSAQDSLRISWNLAVISVLSLILLNLRQISTEGSGGLEAVSAAQYPSRSTEDAVAK